MSYRKITVNGQQYEYVVGKKNTKIKDIGVFDNEIIGESFDVICECCGESMNQLYNRTDLVATGVTPACISKVIREKLEVI